MTSTPLHLVLSRAVRGHDWHQQQQAVAAELEAGLRQQVEQRGLVLTELSDVQVSVGPAGNWARLTRTAVAHPAVAHPAGAQPAASL